MTVGIAAGVAAAVLFGVAALVQAHAVRRLPGESDRLLDFVALALRSPLILLVVAAYLAGFVLHAVAVWLVPLYLAQATIALQLPVTATGAAAVGDRVPARQWAAVAVVALGVLLVCLGAGDPGQPQVSWTFAIALWGGVAVLVSAAVPGAGRDGGTLNGAGIGALSGLAYAGSALSVRAVDWPLTGPAVVSALAIGVYGLLGFWLYSLALDRTTVSAATAPLIVLQTAVPAVVGIWWLGDQVRAGWWPGVAGGIVLALAAAIVLDRLREAADPSPRSVTSN